MDTIQSRGIYIYIICLPVQHLDRDPARLALFVNQCCCISLQLANNAKEELEFLVPGVNCFWVITVLLLSCRIQLFLKDFAPRDLKTGEYPFFFWWEFQGKYTSRLTKDAKQRHPMIYLLMCNEQLSPGSLTANEERIIVYESGQQPEEVR